MGAEPPTAGAVDAEMTSEHERAESTRVLVFQAIKASNVSGTALDPSGPARDTAESWSEAVLGALADLHVRWTPEDAAAERATALTPRSADGTPQTQELGSGHPAARAAAGLELAAEADASGPRTSHEVPKSAGEWSLGATRARE